MDFFKPDDLPRQYINRHHSASDIRLLGVSDIPQAERDRLKRLKSDSLTIIIPTRISNLDNRMNPFINITMFLRKTTVRNLPASKKKMAIAFGEGLVSRFGVAKQIGKEFEKKKEPTEISSSLP